MKAFFTQLTEFVRDGDGALSATRLAFLVAIFIIVGSAGYVSIVNKTNIDFTAGSVGLVASLMAGKAAQSVTENKAAAQVINAQQATN